MSFQSKESGPSPERTLRSNVRRGLLVSRAIEVQRIAGGWPCGHLNMSCVTAGHERPRGIDSAGGTATKPREIG